MTRPVETPVQARCEACDGDSYVIGVNPQWFRPGQPYLIRNGCFLCSGRRFEPSSPPREKEKS